MPLPPPNSFARQLSFEDGGLPERARQRVQEAAARGGG
jgi:hypothetical protein